MIDHGEATYTVAVVKYGRRDIRRSDVFLSYEAYGAPDGPIGMDYYLWVARNASRTFVIDTGYSAAGGARRGRNTIIDPIRALELLDIDPAGLIDVLLTHAHFDHCGNLHRLPNARVTVARREIAFWASDQSHHPLFRRFTDDEDIAYLAQIADQLQLVDDRCEVAPGIEIIPTGGHTPGQYMVRVATGSGHVLLTSDAAHYYEEYLQDMPIAIVVELQAMLDGFATIRAFERAGDLVIPGHDPLVFDRHPPVVNGPLAGLAAFVEPVA